jgi:hypothetical protein
MEWVIVKHIETIASQFCQGFPIRFIQKFGSGNINDTYKVDLDSASENAYILQRINVNVFKKPELIIENMKTICGHIQKELRLNPQKHNGWKIPDIIPTKENIDYYIHSDGTFWRAITYIKNSKTYENLTKKNHASQIGYALGKFHALLNTLDNSLLHDTLPGFHILPGYYKAYQESKKTTSRDLTESLTQYCINIIENREKYVQVLENAKNKNILFERPVHGDPKIANILFDQQTELAIGLIDLDTVKPGLIHYDIGDCIRSSCNLLGEDAEDFDAVQFDTVVCDNILKNYLDQTRDFLTPEDKSFLYEAIHLITFEMGVRFFEDFLAGDQYYKVAHDNHNLFRAVVQFKLLESIEGQETVIRKIVADNINVKG